MSAVEELRQRLAAEAEQKQRVRAAQQQDEVARCRAVLAEQFGQDLLRELDATFRYADRHVEMVLTYRDQTKSFPVNTQEGLRGDYGMNPEGRLAVWIEGIDREFMRREAERANKRRLWLAKLSEPQAHVYIGCTAYARDRLAHWRLLDDPEMAAALARYETREREMVAALEAEQAARQAAQEQARQAERARLLESAATATSWDELWEMGNRVGVDYGCRGDLAGDLELVAAYEAAAQRVQALENHREAMLAGAQTAAFHPFTFYRVTMGIVGVLDAEVIVKTDTFDSLTDAPDERGFWHPLDRDWPVRVHNLVHVEQVTVREPGEMPRWCPTVETEWGAIRVPPGGNGDER